MVVETATIISIATLVMSTIISIATLTTSKKSIEESSRVALKGMEEQEKLKRFELFYNTKVEIYTKFIAEMEYAINPYKDRIQSDVKDDIIAIYNLQLVAPDDVLDAAREHDSVYAELQQCIRKRLQSENKEKITEKEAALASKRYNLLVSLIEVMKKDLQSSKH